MVARVFPLSLGRDRVQRQNSQTGLLGARGMSSGHLGSRRTGRKGTGTPKRNNKSHT